MRNATLFTIRLLGAFAIILGIATPAHAEPPTPPDRPLHVLAVGDSLVFGSGVKPARRLSFPGVVRDRCHGDCRVRNYGKGGACLVRWPCNEPESVLEQARRALAETDPDVVIVHAGRNDLCGVDTAALKHGYRELARMVHSAGAALWYATITPAGTAWQWPCEGPRHEVNAWLRTRPHVLDFEAALTAPGTDLLADRWGYGDGMHLNQAGYARLGRIVYRTVVKR